MISELQLDPKATALLLLDFQAAYVDPALGMGLRLRDEPSMHRYYYDRLTTLVLPNVRRLQEFFRLHELEVIYTRLGVQTSDNRDLAPWSWQAVAQEHPSGPLRFRRGTTEHALLPMLKPVNELVIDKITLSPFNSTPIDQYLRNMGIENLAIGGVLTDGAVETTARSAGDRGFNAIVIEDASAALAPSHHEGALETPSWFVVKTTDELIDQFKELLHRPCTAE